MKVALRPENEAPRRPWPVERGTANYVNISDDLNTANHLRTQRLRLLGVIGQRAKLLADMAWGEAAA